MKSWDERRSREGLGLWEVLYCHSNPSECRQRLIVCKNLMHAEDSLFDFDGGDQVHQVQCRIRRLSDVHVPIPTITQRPTKKEDILDWDSEASSLVEWVGMACMGSQRRVHTLCMSNRCRHVVLQVEIQR